MIKRTLKRSLSILLTLVLLATTFFVFDPSVLKMDADAWVNVQENTIGSSLAAQRAKAPETIYLKLGAKTFEYYSDINVDNGTPGTSQATTGAVTFSNGSANRVRLYVNNLYKKTDRANNTYTPQNSATALSIASTNSSQHSGQVNAIANLSAPTGDGTQSLITTGKIIAEGTNSIDYTFNSSLCSLDCNEGDVYVIEWVVEYRTEKDNTSYYHYAFMYTGVIRERLSLAGVTGRGHHSTTMTNVPKVAAFAFVTGAMDYAYTGNRSCAYVGTTAGVNAHPLIMFVGQDNNGTTYSIPNKSNGQYSTDNFPTSGDKSVLVTTNDYDGTNSYLWTTYSDLGSYASPTPTGGANSNDVTNLIGSAGNGTVPVAYQVVDTSRFATYDQIPYLSVGFIRYYHDRGDGTSKINHIRAQSQPSNNSDYNLGISAVGLDTGNHSDNRDSWRSRTYGLYKLSGNVANGTTKMYIMTEYTQDITVYDYPIHLWFGVGLSVTGVNKGNIRKAYAAYLKSNIDHVYYSAYSSSSFYSNMKTQAMLLCDPTATSGTCSVSADTISTVQSNLVEENTADVITFYVPEIIYLTPSTGNMSTFKYYVDRENAVNGGLRTGEQPTGNIYAKVPGATSVSVACTGGSASISNASGSTEVKGTINSGSVSTALAAGGTSLVEWTATYVINGGTYKTKAYSVAYAPVVDPVSASADGRYDSSYGDRVVKHCITTWIAGLNEITSSHIDGDKDETGVYKHKPLVSGNAIPTGGGSGDILASGSGGSYFYKSDDDAHCGGGCGNVYVDTSRYTNLNQIPNLKIGLDMNNYEGNGTSGKYSKLGYWRNGGTTNETNGGNKDTGAQGSGLVKGSNIFTTAMSDTVNTTDNQAYRVQGSNDMKGSGNGSTRNSKAHAYFYTVPYDKSALRTALNRELATGKQKEWYTSSTWTAYETALKNAATTLGTPIVSASTFQNLINAIQEKAGLLVKNGGTATVNHVKSTGGTLQTAETKSYIYGDTVEAGSNDFTGYTLTSGSRTAPTSANFTPVNDASPDGKGITDTLKNVQAANCTWTFTYTPNKYDVTYNPDGGTFNGYNVTHTYDNIATYDATFKVGAVTNGGNAATAPQKTGYTFRVWKNVTDNAEYANGGEISPWQYDTDDITFIAEYTPRDFVIEYNPNEPNGSGGSFKSGQSGSIGTFNYEEGFTYKNEANSKAMVQKTGYKLVGWTDYDGNPLFTDVNTGTVYYFGDQTNNNIKASVKALVDLQAQRTGVTNPDPVYVYAKWQIEQYNLNLDGILDGSNRETLSDYGTADVYINNSSTATATGVNDFKQAYDYNTPYEIKNIQASTGHYYAGTSTTITGNIAEGGSTVYLPFNTEKYNITMYRNYNDSDNTVTNSLTDDAGKYGTSQTITIPTQTGYTFAGWYSARSGGTQYYGTSSNPAPNPIIIIDHGANGATVNLYAHWEPIMITIHYTAGDEGGIVGSGTGPADYTFAYGAQVAPANNTFTPPAKKTVTFNANGGTCEIASKDSEYSFNKWKSDKDGKLYTAGENINVTSISNFGAQSGTVTLSAQWNQASITLPIPTRTGYTCEGWYTAATGGTSVGLPGATYTPDSSKTLFAHWKENEYTVSLYAYGNTLGEQDKWSDKTPGGTVSGAGSYKYETDTVSISATPATGYEFAGWYTGISADGKTWSGSTTVPAHFSDLQESQLGNKVYYARFDLVTCTVKANAYFNAANQSTGVATTTWSAGATGGTVTVTADTSGTAGATSSATVIRGSSASLSATAATGYHFVGWYSSATVSGDAEASANPWSFTYPANNTTYKGTTVNKYARFDINTSTLKVKPNGGSWNDSSAAEQSFTQAYGTKKSIAAPIRTGYTFGGWTTSPTPLNGALNAEQTEYTYSATVNNAIDTITATWNPINYTINYVLNEQNAKDLGVHGTTHPASAAFDEVFEVSAPSRTGYEFKGWAVSNQDSTARWGTAENSVTNTIGAVCYSSEKAPVYFKNLKSSAATVTLTATWQIRQYTVTLHPMTEKAEGGFVESTTGGTVSGAGTFNYRTTLSISAGNKTGYTFAGWYSNSGMATADAATPPTELGAADVVLWAKFTINTYTVSVTAVANTAAASTTFNAGSASSNGCTASASAASAKYNTTVTLTATEPSEGYTFAGWYDNAQLTGTPVTSRTYTPTIDTDKTYYAKFTVKSSVVNVHAYHNTDDSYVEGTTGGTVTVQGVSPAIAAAQSITMGYKGSYKVTATPATGYTFDGWFTNAALTAAATGATASDTYTATFTKKDETENLYAKFTITTPKLIVNAYYNEGNSSAYSAGSTGGTVAIGSGTAGASVNDNIKYNRTASMTATPATGYQFDGWFKTVNGGALSDEYRPGTGIETTVTSEAMTEARTYYAKFTAKKFTINFNANGGTNGATTSIDVYYNGTATLSATPTKIGCQLLGWSTSNTATTATYGVNAALTKEQVNDLLPASGTTTTLYAVWKELTYTTVVLTASDSGDNTGVYTVNSNCGTAVLNNNASLDKNGNKTIKNGETVADKITATAYTGYTDKEIRYAKVTSVPAAGEDVTGWGTYNTGTANTLPLFDDNSTVVYIVYFTVKQYEVDAYAMSNSATSSTFAKNAAGGTVKLSTATVGGASATANTYFGNTTGVTFVATHATGYEFKGWFKNEACTVSAASEIVDNDETKIKVVASADTVENNTVTKIERYAKFEIASYDAYVRANYYYDGINTAAGTGTNGVTGGTAKVGRIVENTDGSISIVGEVTTASADAVSISAKYNEGVRYTATPATGYDFAGWYYSEDTSENPTDAVDISEDSLETELRFDVVMPDEDVRIVAKFVPKNFVLVLNPNGGIAGQTFAVTLTYNKAVSLDSTTIPTKSGSSFRGWAETNTATTPAYTYTDNNNIKVCNINDINTINRWFNNKNANNEFIIYALWQTASYVVTLDLQGAEETEDVTTSVNVILNEALPTIEEANLPTYEGYKFKGYYTEPGGKGTQYYGLDASGNAVSVKNWNITDNGKLYALWTCPVLKDAKYEDGEWIYTYETTDGTGEEASSSTEILTPQELTDLAPEGAKEISSVDRTEPVNVVNMNKKTADIDLNDYNQAALSSLLENVTDTNTDAKRGAMSQPELNSYVAKVSYNLDLAISGNKKTGDNEDTYKPSIKIYETESKLNSVKQKSIVDAANSATGVTYEDYPKTKDASSYVYAGKQSELLQKPVDYLIYTNSRTPVIALEIDDGEVGTTVAENTSSYPTNVDVQTQSNDSIVKGTAASNGEKFTKGAVAATNNISDAWFKPYVDAGIGVGNGTEASKKAHDYNAKTILYLTPEFTSNRMESTTDEIVYTITPTDDATVENDGFTKAEIANVTTAQAEKYRAFSEDNKPVERIGENGETVKSITVCVSYHNSMNGTSDEGGPGGYLQVDRDQPTNKNQYGDYWLNQVHLFRTAGGASNWELPLVSESVYPVDDMTFRNTGYVYGSFAYVFDATNELVATSYAEAGNYTAAKEAIISSIKSSPSEFYNGVSVDSHAKHFHNGLGLFRLEGWSTNYYPKQGSYVYAHLVDRWGNVFNRVWKNFNVDDIKVSISGNVTNGFKLDEKGGSNIDYITLDGAEVDFITDLDSSYENEVFVTTENTFTVMTDKPASKIPMEVYDYAGNKLSGKIPTNLDGSIKFTVTDECADLSRGAYTFNINDSEVNLWACEPALVRKTEMATTAISGEPTVFTITTMDRATKVQLIENGGTRTYTPDSERAIVVDNGDGTLTWTIKVGPLAEGEHSFAVKCKDNSGWNDCDDTLTTTVIPKPEEKPDLKLSVEDTSCVVDERPALRVSTIKGTEAVRVMYENGYSKTVSRSDDVIVSCVDDIEVWSLTTGAFNTAGENTASVYIQYNGKWQKKDIATCTITVKEPVKKTGEIYSVTILDKDVTAGEKATIEVLTSKITNKLQFVSANDTYTVTAANAEIKENGDGTLTWTIEKRFSKIGANEVILKAKSPNGWGEAAAYGTVTAL